MIDNSNTAPMTQNPCYMPPFLLSEKYFFLKMFVYSNCCCIFVNEIKIKEMKAPVYTEQDLAKYGKQLAPITKEQIKLETWLCGWAFVKHSSGHIVKCEATRDNKWRILGTKGVFPIEEGQLYFGIKKPAKKKEW